MSEKTKPTTVDDYLEQFTGEAREKMDEIRRIVLDAVPDAEEVISYGIPAYKYHGWLIYFSAYTKHVSISMLPDTFETFPGDLSGYKTSKSAVQFPFGKPLPESLIRELIAHRIQMSRGEQLRSTPIASGT